jgi:hypothetical protein
VTQARQAITSTVWLLFFNEDFEVIDLVRKINERIILLARMRQSMTIAGFNARMDALFSAKREALTQLTGSEKMAYMVWPPSHSSASRVRMG